MRSKAAICAFLLTAAACSPAEPAGTTTTPGDASIQTPASSVPDEPNRSVQAGIDWFIGVLDGTDLDEAEFERRFAPIFREQVGFESFLAVVEGFRRRGPYSVVERGGSDAIGYAVIQSEEEVRYRINGQLDADGRFEGLLISPESFAEMANPPESVGEALDLLDQIGSFGGIVAEITDGSCSPIASIDADDPIPLGSAYKLYLLGALALQIDAGVTSWDASLVITDGIKSIPTGTLQDRASGSVVSVREAAELMISISDNTAADLLADHLGRDVIEASLSDLGMADPALNMPFLTTLEFAVLKLVAGEDTRQAYITGTEDQRRQILADLADIGVEQVPVLEFVEPIAPDTIEWFATPSDLCRLALRFSELAQREGLEPIATILSLNPGVPDDDGLWSRVWFKGGSEPGLLAIWWLVESADGRRYVLAGSNVDPVANIDADRALLVWSAGRDVLGQNAG